MLYLISGFAGPVDIADVNVGVSLATTMVFLVVCLAIVWWMFRTGYRLKS